MQISRSRRYDRPDRQNFLAGFALVELHVVIAIIGVLVALLLAAVQAARKHYGFQNFGRSADVPFPLTGAFVGVSGQQGVVNGQVILQP